MTRARSLLLLLPLALTAACPPPDPLTAYAVDVVVLSDCTQVAMSAVQCEDEEALQAVTRSGRWVIEDLYGANAINPTSNFVLTNDRGRSVTGIHFPDNGALAETESCDGSGGECYFARTQRDTFDPESECLQQRIQAWDFKIDPDGTLTGLYQDARIDDEACGTPSVGQILAEVTGTLLEEEVYARDVYESGVP